MSGPPRKTRFTRALGACAGCAVTLTVATPSQAAEIRVKVGDCKTGVELVARDAPLSKVLERLAQSLAFQLHLEAPADSLVNVRMSAPATELIAALAAQERIMVSQARDPRCPGQSRVVRVWVLPKGEGAAAPAAAVQKKTPVTETATREQMRSYEEKSRKLKEEYDAYVKAHGKPPPGEEQEEARR